MNIISNVIKHFQVSGLSVVGRSTQRALNLKKNWVSTDVSPGLAASVIANNQENTIKNMLNHTAKKQSGSVEVNKTVPVISTSLQKDVGQAKPIVSCLTKYERTVPSISASLSGRGIYNKEPSNPNPKVDSLLKSQADRLSSLQSLLKVA